MTPIERVESLHRELAQHYGGGDDAELRAAAKLLLVALAEFKRHGGPGWEQLLADYVRIAVQEPERFERILNACRSGSGRSGPEDTLLC